MVSIRIATTKGSQGVQAFVMIPLVSIPIGKFSTKNPMPYFRPPTQNPPSRFNNFGGGIPIGGGGSPFHGNGGPLGGGQGQGESTIRGATLGIFMTCM
jgi:hypothetical protein